MMLLDRPRLRRSPTVEAPAPSTLRVAIVAESFLPTVNGVSNSVVRLVEHLEATGHDALVIAPGPGDVQMGRTPIVRVPGFDLPWNTSLRVGSPLVRLTSTLRDFRPDVVHLAAPALLGVAGARAAKALDVPSIAVFQTDLVGFARRYGMGLAAVPLWAWLRRAHATSALTLAPSTATAWMLRQHGFRGVERWTRGVDLERFHPRHRNPNLHRRLAPNGEIVVGCVGRLAKEKQLERLAPIAAMPKVRLVLVGDGPERGRLERQLPGATFAGFQGGAALAQYHASFDVFVHAGLDETFCQAVQEALASGVPVVAPASGEPLDLVAHGSNGFLWSPEQPETLAGAVAEFAARRELREQLGAAARASVEHRPWSAVMDELLGHYRRVVDVPIARSRTERVA